MKSITLQTGDTIVTSGNLLGQLQFAASAESDGSAAILAVGRVSCQAEGSFSSASNPASLVLATSSPDANSVVDRIKITDNGHVVPIVDDTYDLGDTNLGFRNGYFSEGIVLDSNTPTSTTDKLYQTSGELYFNGSTVTGAELDVQQQWTASQYADSSTLTDAATISWDMSTTLNDVSVTLGGNRTLGAPTNVKVGQKGVLRVVQDGTGGRTLTFNSVFKFPGGTAPTLTTASGSVDRVYYHAISSSRFECTSILDFS